MSELIRLEKLSKEYVQGDHVIRALSGVDLTINKGDFIAIMGPSGCGKSTLMYMLGFLLSPSSGKYLLEGRDASSLSDNERAVIRNEKIGFIFQSYNLLPRTSVLENVLLPTEYSAGVDKKRARERALELIKMVGISHRIDSNPNQLSGGEQQRVAIARALVVRPSVVLADEPTGNLDSASAEDVLEILERVNGQGATIVMVTHSNEVAQRASRIVRLADGIVVADELVLRATVVGAL